MVYGGIKMEAEEYFAETEQYIERFFGNQISAYDVKNGFPRVSNAYENHYRAVTDYKPEGYEIPEGSPFTTHDIAMLGYLAVEIGDIAFPDVLLSEDSSMSEEEKDFVKIYNDSIPVNYRGMCLDSFFSNEPRLLTGYGTYMKRAYDYTKSVIQNNDMDGVAKICSDGLRQLQKSMDALGTAKGTNWYANCFVCAEILKMIEKNPQLKEKVQISPEEMKYYEGLRRLEKITQRGEIQKDQLDSDMQLSGEERQDLEKEVHRYNNLSIMIALECLNVTESEETAKKFEKCVTEGENWKWEKKVDDGKFFQNICSAGAFAFRPMGKVIRELGECQNLDVFMDEISNKIDQARNTGELSGITSFKDIKEKIDVVEETIQNGSIAEELVEKREKERSIREKENPYQKQIREASYRRHKLPGMRNTFRASWKRMNEWEVDNFLRGSSNEFRAIREKMQQINTYLEQSAGKKIPDEKHMQEMLAELRTCTGKYLDKKDAAGQKPRTPKEGDSYAERRYNFVLELEENAKMYEKALQERNMESTRQLITEISGSLLQSPEFEQYKTMDRRVFDKAVEFTLVQKQVLNGKMDDTQRVHTDKLVDLIKTDTVKMAQFAENMMSRLKKENKSCNVSDKMVEIFDDGIESQKRKNGQSRENTRQKSNVREAKNESVKVM